MIANTEQFFGKHLQQLLTIDTDYLAKHQKELTDEMRDDFKEMKDRLQTNKDQKRMFDDYGDSYVSGILLLHYKLIPTKTLARQSETDHRENHRKHSNQIRLYQQ